MDWIGCIFKCSVLGGENFITRWFFVLVCACHIEMGSRMRITNKYKYIYKKNIEIVCVGVEGCHPTNWSRPHRDTQSQRPAVPAVLSALHKPAIREKSI